MSILDKLFGKKVVPPVEGPRPLSPWLQRAGYTKDASKAPKPYIPDWDKTSVADRYLGTTKE